MSWKVLSIILYGHTLPNSILLTTEYLTALIARTDYMFCAGFFCTRKNFFIFFQNHATNHTLLYRYGAERGINTFHVITERGCDDMKPSDFQKTIQCQFDCKLKRVVKGIVRNYRKELKRRRNKEISYCELPEIVVEKLAVWDEYESDYTAFDVCGIEVRVLDDDLAEAIKYLSEKDREILLMYFFLGMSDTEIGDRLKINRSTSFRSRKNSLEEIKKKLKENMNDEKHTPVILPYFVGCGRQRKCD